MTYFVTGATGFIGRHLVERPLARDGDIHVLVRAGSTDKLQALIEKWGPQAEGRVHPVIGDLVCEAIRAKPKQINTRLGTFGEVAYTLFPKAVDQILSAAYKVFPDSAASKGQKDPDEHASTEQVALAHLMRGVHW